jgi:hypothetical protein
LSNQATKLFTKVQKAKRKDIKQSFGILKSCFQVLEKPALQWYPGNLTLIMKTCIILHNMLVKYQTNPNEFPPLPSSIVLIPPCSEPFCLWDQRIRKIEMQSLEVHHRLTADLIAHLWDKNGKNQDSSSQLEPDSPPNSDGSAL